MVGLDLPLKRWLLIKLAAGQGGQAQQAGCQRAIPIPVTLPAPILPSINQSTVLYTVIYTWAPWSCELG